MLLFRSSFPILHLVIMSMFTVTIFQAIGLQAFGVDNANLDTPDTVGLGTAVSAAASGPQYVSGSHIGHMNINGAGSGGADLLPGPELPESEPPSTGSLDTVAVPSLVSSASLASSSASASASSSPVGTASSDVGAIHPLEVHGSPQTGLYVALNLGTPSQTLNLLFDTGSTTNAVACREFEELSGEHFKPAKYTAPEQRALVLESKH